MKIYEYHKWVDEIFGTDTKIRVAHNDVVLYSLKNPKWVINLGLDLEFEKIYELNKILREYFPYRAFRYAGSTCIFEDRNDLLMFALRWNGKFN
jgi:hypothetical protein